MFHSSPTTAILHNRFRKSSLGLCRPSVRSRPTGIFCSNVFFCLGTVLSLGFLPELCKFRKSSLGLCRPSVRSHPTGIFYSNVFFCLGTVLSLETQGKPQGQFFTEPSPCGFNELSLWLKKGERTVPNYYIKMEVIWN